ncbi:MAG TPA: hypothetical protein VM537_13880 [Anaerolineae bacterium]|nr:hypothetical protein [Anaerolineae bacterium]
MSEKKSKQDRKQAEKPVVTAEDAERMYAQAWAPKVARVRAELLAAVETIEQTHGVKIGYQAQILPAFLAEAKQGTLPPRP